MMRFWTNFAKKGVPGKSTKGKEGTTYNNKRNFIIIDKKKYLEMQTDNVSFKFFILELYKEKRVSSLEKCVILFQMFIFVGNDIYENEIKNYLG
jgi:hypothetical protein